jgi:hypothetical protein
MKVSGLTGSRLSGASITMAPDMHGIVRHKPTSDYEGIPWIALPRNPRFCRCARVTLTP